MYVQEKKQFFERAEKKWAGLPLIFFFFLVSQVSDWRPGKVDAKLHPLGLRDSKGTDCDWRTSFVRTLVSSIGGSTLVQSVVQSR